MRRRVAWTTAAALAGVCGHASADEQNPVAADIPAWRPPLPDECLGLIVFVDIYTTGHAALVER